jgi:hypothetical protein
VNDNLERLIIDTKESLERTFRGLVQQMHEGFDLVDRRLDHIDTVLTAQGQQLADIASKLKSALEDLQ